MNRGMFATKAIFFSLTALVASLLLSSSTMHIGATVVLNQSPEQACQSRYTRCVRQADNNAATLATCAETRTICLANCEK